MNYLMECSNCGAENKLLFKTISKNGIIKVCNQCLGKLKSPIINDSSRVDFEKPEVKLTVGERLARLAGVKLEKRRIEPIKPEQNNKLKREEDKLKEMINKNYVKKFEERPDDNMTLIENFHWVIMRARRSKKITQEQLAESISEPVAAIAMAESGKIATGNQKLITKIENALGIRLVKSDEIQRTNNEIKRPVEVPRELSFDSSSAKTLTISNLQEIKKQKEARILKENEEKLHTVSEYLNKYEMVNVPMYESVGCGELLFADSTVQDMIPVRKDYMHAGSKYFVLKTTGDSMNKVGINSGDLVLCKKEYQVHKGDKVVAIVGDDATIKEYHKENGRIILKPCSTNSIHKPLEFENDNEMKVIAVVVKVLDKDNK